MQKTIYSDHEKTEFIESLKSVLFYFILGGTTYSLIEILWRGHTHWTMTILGGIVVVILKKIDETFKDAPLLFKCTLGTAVITILELFAGIIINRRHGLAVWSYESIDYNILGQICPIFTIAWFFLCIAAFYIFRFIERINP